MTTETVPMKSPSSTSRERALVKPSHWPVTLTVLASAAGSWAYTQLVGPALPAGLGAVLLPASLIVAVLASLLWSALFSLATREDRVRGRFFLLLAPPLVCSATGLVVGLTGEVALLHALAKLTLLGFAAGVIFYLLGNDRQLEAAHDWLDWD